GNPNCTGANISPPLAWINAPARTQSFAIIVHDQAGQNGLGVLHWIAYGIPATVTSIAEGEASTGSGHFVGGRNIYGQPTYAGPCPPRGNAPQHYVFTLIATDLEPALLQPGLGQPELLAALKGHNLAAASLVLRFAQ
ncbi:MAG: YbhB/YbcL family Raf kinase inhibitor-like protein, partial [Pseudomonadota bacterium]|nr:YbhB/YbcL family Raf kinase inhibitor-like protein [Pseudomonadota bacterium]